MDTKPQAAARPRSLTRLQVHDIVLLEGRHHRVILANECRARCLPLKRQKVSFTPHTGANAGKTVGFEAPASDDAANISPNAELEILGRWDPVNQRARFFQGEASAAPLPAAAGPFPASDPVDPSPTLTQHTLL